MRLREVRDMARAVGPVLKRAVMSGQLLRPQCELREPDPDILCEYDVEIPLEDGSFVTANVFRSKQAQARAEKVPALMCAHPYDNRLIPALGKTPFGGPPQQYRMIPQKGKPAFSKLTSWEAPDPNFWVASGYAVVNMNMPGYASSGGRPTLFSHEQTDAFSQAIDWVGEQDWCTGSVGLSGVSYLAMSQYGVAATESPRGTPRCLKAISPWEGMTDIYADLFYEGGVEEKGFPVFWWFTEVKPTINCSVEEFVAIEGQLPQDLSLRHPFFDDYWSDRTPDLSQIDIPMLVCASFSDQGLHTRGSFRAFRQAKSPQKWVYTHRDLKWDSYYSQDALEFMRDFFDCFLKGDPNSGFLERAPVRLEVRAERDDIHQVRSEAEWPLARTQYRELYLEGDGETLAFAANPTRSELAYDAQKDGLRFRHCFEEDTELTGYMKLHLEVEARSGGAGGPPPDDMAIFVGIEKLRSDGSRVPFYGSVGNHHDMVARGLLRISRRQQNELRSTEWEPVLLHQSDEKLRPGEVVPVDIAINPSSTFFANGEMLELVISPREIVPSPPFVKDRSCNRGLHVIHVGGDTDSHLLVPVIP